MIKYVIDPCILKLADVYQELGIVQYYRSDLIVLNLSSGDTLYKIKLVEKISTGSNHVLSTTLYFTQVRLLGVNANNLRLKQCVMYSWEKMIWFKSFIKSLGKDNYLDNKQNMVA